jgi:methionyl aminopeptidase
MIIIKNKKQIEIMRQGGKILAEILNEVAKAVKPGITTKELDELAQELIFAYGGKPAFLGYQGFPAALCASVNDVIVHAAPKGDKLKESDIVGLDLGILYPFKDCAGCFMLRNCPPKKKIEGLYTDMAITVPVGKISKKAQKLIDTTKQSLEVGLKEVKPGNHIGDIGFAIQQFVESQGFSIVRNLVGHGVGKEVHEPPQIPNFGKKGEGEKLKPGMTLAIEPMVAVGGYELEKTEDGHGFRVKDKSLTAHFEHTIVVTESGYDVLTKI